MDNPETHVALDTKQITKTNKTKQKTGKMSNTDPTTNGE
jgi:hypothetical protein